MTVGHGGTTTTSGLHGTGRRMQKRSGGKPGAEGGVGAAAFPGTGAACSDGQAREQDDDGRGCRRVRDTENMYVLLYACDNWRSEGSSNREQQQQRGEQQQ